MRVARTVEVRRSPREAAAYLADFSNAVDWDPGTVACERQDSGPLAVGATWRNVSRFAGRTVELTYRLDTWTDERVVLIGTNPKATSRDDITIEPAGAGSKLTYQATITFTGAARLLEPLLRLMFERVATKTADQLTAQLNVQSRGAPQEESA